MAKIRNSNPKQSGGGYERLVGDKDMASIFTKAQSTKQRIYAMDLKLNIKRVLLN